MTPVQDKGSKCVYEMKCLIVCVVFGAAQRWHVMGDERKSMWTVH